MMKQWSWFVVVLLVGIRLGAAEIDGTWSVWTPPDASSTELYAVREFCDIFERMSGQRPVAATGAIPPEHHTIVITSKAAATLPSEVLAAMANGIPADDRSILSFDGNRLFLCGNNPRSALYAVYDFFKDHCQARWLWPGESGEFLPPRTAVSLDVPYWQVSQAAFRYRGFHWIFSHYDRDTETWAARNRLNIMRSDPVDGAAWRREWNDERIAKGLHMMFSTHNIHLDADWFAKRPDLFALVNGVRTDQQLCWSNPEVDEQMIQRFVTAIAEYPQVEIISIFPADSTVVCQCGSCAAVTKTDLWFAMYNRLVRGIAQAYPDKQFSTIAYQDYRTTPSIDLPPSVFVEYCMYNRCYVHPFGRCEVNASALRGIAAWRQKNVPLGVYGYEFDIFSPEMPVPYYPMLADGIARIHEAGVISYITEGRPLNVSARDGHGSVSPYMHNRFGYYLVAQLLWEPKQDWHLVLRDFCTVSYGPSAEAMYRFFAGLSDAWLDMEAHFTYYGASPIGAAGLYLSNERIAEATGALDAAVEAAALISDAEYRETVLEQIEMERRSFDVWLEYYRRYRVEHDQMGMTVPRTATPGDFSGAVRLPDFRNREGSRFQPTEAWINYDDQALYCKVVCHDATGRQPQTPERKPDGSVWQDECLELFLGIPGDPDGEYRHLIVNRSGVRYDAVVRAPDDFDTGWSPAWTAQVENDASEWTVTIAIPFSELPARPQPGDRWRFQLIRGAGSRTDIAASGFPNTSYHDRNAFGELTFSARQESRSALLFAVTTEREMNQMQAEFEQADYQITTLGASDFEVNDQATGALRRLEQTNYPFDTVILRLPGGMAPSVDFCRNYLLPRLRAGGLVVISTYGELALDRWFDWPDLRLSWSGWDFDPARLNRLAATGQWRQSPHDLEPIFRKCISPCSGYRPLPGSDWRELAMMSLKNGEEYASLLAHPVGRGMLVVTSADFGFAGADSIFGEGEGKRDSVKLIDNLLEMMK